MITPRLRSTAVLTFLSFAFAGFAAEPRLPRDELLLYRGPDGKPKPVTSIEEWGKRRAEIVHGITTTGLIAIVTATSVMFALSLVVHPL